MDSTKLYIGQVVDDDYWKNNNASKKWNNVSEIEGWGRRYKVRINGIHSENKAELPDVNLPWLEVMYPVTAGTGHKSSYQTPNITQGSIVVILFNNLTAPFIIGCLGNNEQTILARGDVFDKGCIPFSGFKSNELPPVYSTTPNNKISESTSNAQLQKTIADKEQQKDGESNTELSTTTLCEKAPLGAIQNKLKNFIKDITAAKASLGKPISEGGVQYSIEDYLKAKIQDASKLISVPLKTLISLIQEYITNKINNNLKNVYYTLFPNELQRVKNKIETANDSLACLFRKIIKNLIKMVSKFLASAVDYLINTPLCAVENFVGALIGKITGLLTSAIDAILAPLKAVLGIFDIVSDILGFVSDLLSGLSCDEEPTCAKIKDWSIWDGPESIAGSNTDVSGLISKIKSFAANVQQSVDPDNFNFDLDFGDVFEDTCNVGAIACGPPTVQFSGGGGTGASGNAIISALGQVIGVDITNFGNGYTSAPLIKFYDACGKGSGAVGRAIIGPVANSVADNNTNTNINSNNNGNNNTENNINNNGNNNNGNNNTVNNNNGNNNTGNNNTVNNNNGNNGITTGNNNTNGVTNVIMTDPGSGYLSAPDGSLGGDGRTLTDPVKSSTSIYPSKSNGQYPVILKLCEVIINESGFGYSEGDQVIIEPSNGATARATMSPNGSITKIDVLTKGEGFTEMPRIYINSQTGYSASLIANLCVERVGDNINIVPINIEKVIKVIDCPGK